MRKTKREFLRCVKNIMKKTRKMFLEKNAEWRVANKEYKNAYDRKYMKASKKRLRERRRNNPQIRIADNLRRRINSAIKNNQKAGSAVRDLGCSVLELKRHLESQFQVGMSWDNYGDWHIYHIKPLASFDLTDRKQFLEACCYTNLQPLWAEDNLSKGYKHV